MNAPAMIGHNSADAFTVARDTITDLMDEARQWCDGEPVTSAEHAEGLRLLQDKLRAAHKEGDAARMAATEPHRTAEKAINDEWRPILAPAKTALESLSVALGVWQATEKRRADAEARALREAADKAARDAAEARAAADLANLAEREKADAAIAEAERLARIATAAEKAPVGVRSVVGGRASALQIDHKPVEIVDGKAAVQDLMRRDADAMREHVMKRAAVLKGDVAGVRYVDTSRAV